MDDKQYFETIMELSTKNGVRSEIVNEMFTSTNKFIYFSKFRFLINIF